MPLMEELDGHTIAKIFLFIGYATGIVEAIKFLKTQ